MPPGVYTSPSLKPFTDDLQSFRTYPSRICCGQSGTVQYDDSDDTANSHHRPRSLDSGTWKCSHHPICRFLRLLFGSFCVLGARPCCTDLRDQADRGPQRHCLCLRVSGRLDGEPYRRSLGDEGSWEVLVSTSFLWRQYGGRLSIFLCVEDGESRVGMETLLSAQNRPVQISSGRSLKLVELRALRPSVSNSKLGIIATATFCDRTGHLLIY
jgi:hypothetical protein